MAVYLVMQEQARFIIDRRTGGRRCMNVFACDVCDLFGGKCVYVCVFRSDVGRLPRSPFGQLLRRHVMRMNEGI